MTIKGLTRNELVFIRNNLLAKRAYRNTEIPHGAEVWHPWMESFLGRVNDKLRTTSKHYDDQSSLYNSDNYKPFQFHEETIKNDPSMKKLIFLPASR